MPYGGILVYAEPDQLGQIDTMASDLRLSRSAIARRLLDIGLRSVGDDPSALFRSQPQAPKERT